MPPNEETPAGVTTPVGDASQPSPEDERVEALLAHTIDVPALASAVEQQQAADAADTLETLADDEAVELLGQMDDRSASDALAEMQTPLAVSIVEDLLDEDAGYAAQLLSLMAPDDAADLLQALVPLRAEQILTRMPVGEAAVLRHLAGYDEESAGGLMTTEFATLRAGMTAAEAIDHLRRTPVPEGMQHLPVVDAGGRLVGLAGLRDVLVAPADAPVASWMDGAVRAARVTMDREEVAREFDRYDLTLLPVVDDRQRLLGVVTVDDVIDIIRAEQTEDVQMTVGAGAGEAVYSGLGEKFRGRFPWLGASLVLTALAATVVLLFEDMIRTLPILAFLMPLIAALTGNAGHQAFAVTLRGIVLEEVRRDRVSPLVVREALLGLLNGAVLGVLIFGGVIALGAISPSASWQIGLIAGVSTTVAMSVGTFAGACVPLLMQRLGTDPAHASAIFLIMITDAVSFSVLLGLTFILLGSAS